MKWMGGRNRSGTLKEFRYIAGKNMEWMLRGCAYIYIYAYMYKTTSDNICHCIYISSLITVGAADNLLYTAKETCHGGLGFESHGRVSNGPA